VNKKHVLASLRHNAKWVKDHKRTKPEFDWKAQDILVGCSQLLRQCDQSLAGWIDRRDRRAVLGRIQRSWATQNGKRALRDLIEFTTEAIQAIIHNFSSAELADKKSLFLGKKYSGNGLVCQAKSDYRMLWVQMSGVKSGAGSGKGGQIFD